MSLQDSKVLVKKSNRNTLLTTKLYVHHKFTNVNNNNYKCIRRDKAHTHEVLPWGTKRYFCKLILISLHNYLISNINRNMNYAILGWINVMSTNHTDLNVISTNHTDLYIRKCIISENHEGCLFNSLFWNLTRIQGYFC